MFSPWAKRKNFITGRDSKNPKKEAEMLNRQWEGWPPLERRATPVIWEKTGIPISRERLGGLKPGEEKGDLLIAERLAEVVNHARKRKCPTRVASRLEI